MKKLLTLTLLFATTTAQVFHFNQINRQQNISFDQFINREEFVVVKFSMPGCGPCARLTPKFRELSELSELRDIAFVELNIRNFPAVMNKYNIRSVPRMFYFKNGNVVGSHSGGQSTVNSLRENIRRYFGI